MRAFAWMLAAAVVLGAHAAAAASPLLHPPIKILRCDAQLKQGRSGGYSTTGYTGYTSGYYSTGPYYWNDPLGRAYYQPPTKGSSTLFIDFVNSTNKAMKAIDFGLVVRGVVIAETRDIGSFAPGAEVKKKYGIDPLTIPRAAPACVPLKIEYADGTVWVDPELPRPDKTLYQGHP